MRVANKYKNLAINLKKLLFERDIRPIDLARAVDLPAATISRLINGKSMRPYRSSLEPIAAYFSITVEQLLQGSDREGNVVTSNHSAAISVPIIDWADILHCNKDNLSQYEKDVLLAGNDIGTNSFAVVMNDFSMEPIINKGSYLIISPDHEVWDRCFVLVLLGLSKTVVFRQLIIDADNRYFKPLNPDLGSLEIKKLSAKDRILGVLVENRTNFSKPSE